MSENGGRENAEDNSLNTKSNIINGNSNSSDSIEKTQLTPRGIGYSTIGILYVEFSLFVFHAHTYFRVNI